GLGRSCRGYDLALLCFAIMRHLYMNPEQWQRIADLYELALAREPENRSVFLREVCGEDEDLQQEVESLLRQNVGCDGVLEHIAAIYDLEKFGDLRFLVLELVEGETLADRLVRGPIAIREALPIAMQIAEALEAAHEKGIVHRDLKPANVKITPEGKVKVLDF